MCGETAESRVARCRVSCAARPGLTGTRSPGASLCIGRWYRVAPSVCAAAACVFCRAFVTPSRSGAPSPLLVVFVLVLALALGLVFTLVLVLVSVSVSVSVRIVLVLGKGFGFGLGFGSRVRVSAPGVWAVSGLGLGLGLGLALTRSAARSALPLGLAQERHQLALLEGARLGEG